MLPQKKGLKILNLRENELEDVGAIWLAKSISTLEKLESLDLSQNQVRRNETWYSLLPQSQQVTLILWVVGVLKINERDL